MAEEGGVWRTINGTPVFIKDGETATEALNRTIAKKNSDTRERQIKQNKKQADRAKSQQKPQNKNNQSTRQRSQQSDTPPRALRLPNKSANEANKTSDVLHLGTRKRYKFAENTDIRQVYCFAGKGCAKEFRDAQKYADRYGGKPEDWQHCTGNARITDGKNTYTREVHWVQREDGRIREAFIKVRTNNLEKRK